MLALFEGRAIDEETQRQLAEIATAVEAAASWTAISTPAENNALLMPVSRGWSRVPPLANQPTRKDSDAVFDWSYAVFDW